MHEGRATQRYLENALEAWRQLDGTDREEADFDSRRGELQQAMGDLEMAISSSARDEERESRRAAIAASERERQRWAMELHDETLQDLGALRVMVEGALKRGDADIMRNAMVMASAQIEESINGLETLIQMLRPATLDQFGIGAAVESLVERMNARTDFLVDVHVDLHWETGRMPTRLETQTESTIYRVVQEALNNAIKHSDAIRTSVSITEDAGQVTVIVEDDGKGFSPLAANGGRFGLSGMRERVDLVDGTMEIDSSPGKGTCVEVHLPALHRERPEMRESGNV
ncbi:MAG: sensor histidine kinase [Solirubrobacterales bacterium]